MNDEELSLLVSPRLIEKLREIYTPDYFLSKKGLSAEYLLGYMEGAMDLINYLEQFAYEDEEGGE